MNVNPLTSTSDTTAVDRPKGHHHGGGRDKTIQAVADELGMDPEALKKALKGGETMSSLAAKSGVSQDDLVKTIAATLPARGPGGAVDTTSMATDIANGERPQRLNKTEADVVRGIQALSSALGISGQDLVGRLTDGTGIADLLAKNPDVSAQLAQNQNRGALLDGYS